MSIARLCLLIAAFLVPLAGARSGPLPPALLGALALGGWTAWAVARPRPALPARIPLLLPLGLVLVSLGVTTVTSVYRFASLLVIWQWLVVCGLVLLAAVMPFDRKDSTYGVGSFLAGTLVGIVHGWQGWVTWLVGEGQATWRIQSLWENANCYAAFLLLVLPALLLGVRHAPDRRQRLALGVLSVLALMTLLMTQSRGGLLAFALTALVFAPLWLWAERKLSARTLGLLAAGFVLLGALTLLSPLGKRLLDPAVRAKQLHSQMFRVYTWQGTLRMIAARPWLGFGPGTFPSAYGRYQIAGYTRHAHQIFLQTLAESGVVGLLAFLALVGALIRHGLRLLRHARAATGPEGPPRAALAIALLAGLTALLLHGLFDATWGYPGIPLTLLLGALLLLRGLEPAPVTRPAPLGVRILAPLLLAVVLLPLWRAVQAEHAMTTARELQVAVRTAATDAARLEALQAARVAYLRALQFTPHDAAVLRRAGSFLPAAEARPHLQRARQLEPTNAANWLFWGNFLRGQGEDAAALAAYRTAETRQPFLFPALYAQAQAAWRTGDQAVARRAVARILATVGTPRDLYHPIEVPEPWYPLAYYARAQCHWLEGDDRQALTDFQQAERAIDLYEQGFTREAEAWSFFTQTDGERARLADLRLRCRAARAALLAVRDPAAAARLRATLPAAWEPPAPLRGIPFP